METITRRLHRLRARPDPLLQLRFIFGFPKEVRAIRKLIRAQSIDVVVICGLVNPHAAIAARLERIPVVWQLLDTRPPMALRRLLMPLATRLSDVIMTTGVQVARVHPGASRLGDRLFPFFPPVDTVAYREDPERRAAARRELGASDDSFLVGTVGNLNPQKGHEYLLRAAALVRQANPGVEVRVLGAPTPTQSAYERQLRNEAHELGLGESSRSIFADPGARVAELLPAFDVFLLTAVPRSEGVPTVILEAMACGVPVVSTDVGAVREVVEDGVTGFVVPPLDAEAIADATLRILGDDTLRSRMGKVARERAVERYDVEVCADVHVQAFEAAIEHSERREHRNASRTLPSLPPDLRGLLVCPACFGGLSWSPAQVACQTCPRSYPIVDDIPVMLFDRSHAEHDELDHGHGRGHGHKQQQAAFFDREEAAEFEISRPHGTAALYRWLLLQKFRRSVRVLRPLSRGQVALTVCGGSGMDAEFLARSGLQVIASDISLGAARRTRERATRYGLAIAPVVADVEHLPFADRSIDLVYVHDGLHHLEQPLAGVAEMARVASRAVSVTEPARAAATALAVRFGLALQREEAGNQVARMMPDELVECLRAVGLSPVHEERYAMYYPHQPGRVLSLLSKPVLFAMARFGWRIGNRLIGRWGNKVTVQAVRER